MNEVALASAPVAERHADAPPATAKGWLPFVAFALPFALLACFRSRLRHIFS